MGIHGGSEEDWYAVAMESNLIPYSLNGQECAHEPRPAPPTL